MFSTVKSNEFHALYGSFLRFFIKIVIKIVMKHEGHQEHDVILVLD
jgi:hypothetical protein